MMVGILVLGDNHFIVRGPMPDRADAIALARHWTFIEIGQVTSDRLAAWRISSKEVRENLQWAVIVPGSGERTAAVVQLLDELAARGVAIHDYTGC